MCPLHVPIKLWSFFTLNVLIIDLVGPGDRAFLGNTRKSLREVRGTPGSSCQKMAETEATVDTRGMKRPLVEDYSDGEEEDEERIRKGKNFVFPLEPCFNSWSCFLGLRCFHVTCTKYSIF